MTSRVPASVPSLLHSSVPVSGRKAAKNRILPTRVSESGEDEPAPGTMSLTRAVPSALPSLFHSSRPAPGVEAVKNKLF